MVTKIGEYGASYVPPLSEKKRTSLLERKKRAVEIADETTRDSWAAQGISLIVDGWSDTRKRSIHGVVAYSKGESYFVDSHDASETGKSADVLAAEWATTIEMLGPDYVVAVVADGEPVNKATGVILANSYPKITVCLCMAHCLNNLLKDIGALKWISPIIDAASAMVSFVLNHNRVRHEFSKRSNLSLLKYSETRFAFNFLMLDRVSTCSGSLRGLFLSDEFLAFPESLTNMGRECRARADDASWWDSVENIDTMVKPVIHLLRVRRLSTMHWQGVRGHGSDD